MFIDFVPLFVYDALLVHFSDLQCISRHLCLFMIHPSDLHFLS